MSDSKSSAESVSRMGFKIAHFLISLKIVGNSEFINSTIVLIFLD